MLTGKEHSEVEPPSHLKKPYKSQGPAHRTWQRQAQQPQAQPCPGSHHEGPRGMEPSPGTPQVQPCPGPTMRAAGESAKPRPHKPSPARPHQAGPQEAPSRAPGRGQPGQKALLRAPRFLSVKRGQNTNPLLRGCWVPMTDRSSQALWEGRVLYPQGRRDMATAEGWTVGPGCRSARAENAAATSSTHGRLPQAQANWELAGPQDTMVTSELVQHETQQNATLPDQHVTTPRNPR